MSLLNRLRDVLTQPSIDDAHLYAQVANEIDSGFRREGLWAKALTECNFDENAARSIYMRMAVKAIPIEEKSAMENAIAQYNSRNYQAALKGLLLLIERQNDATAKICLANMYIFDLNPPKKESMDTLDRVCEGSRCIFEVLRSSDRSADVFIAQTITNMFELCHRKYVEKQYDNNLAAHLMVLSVFASRDAKFEFPRFSNIGDWSSVYLANVYWFGLCGETDKDYAKELIELAGKSLNSDIRTFVGETYEAFGQLQLGQYHMEFAANQGNVRAKELIQLRYDRYLKLGFR